MKTGFSAQAHGAVLDFTGDDDQEIRQRKGATVWDKRSKKYVRVQDDKKRIKTESGVYINASYKTNRCIATLPKVLMGMSLCLQVRQVEGEKQVVPAGGQR